MSHIDISKQVINIRSNTKKAQAQALEKMVMPEWMKTPFDEYFNEQAQETTPNNVVHVDFSAPALEIPKALAASSITKQAERWYDQGVIAFKDTGGAILNIVFNKTSHSDTIDITVTVTEGESGFLKPYCGLSNLSCSLFDNRSELASLTAAVNHNGTFMHAEGIVLENYEPKDSDDTMTLRFTH